MKIGVDGRKIAEAAVRGPLGTLNHASELGMSGVFFRTVLDMSPTLDQGALHELRARADELGAYLETGLGKVNPYVTPETPELRKIGDGDIFLGFRRMMEACAAIDCRELWISTASFKSGFSGNFVYDRFRTDVTWPEQLRATEAFLHKLAPVARDLGIHMNLETHEEITTFEVVRLVEAVGPDVMGVVLDTLNPMQRGEHPVYAARRVAPYVRQTHMKDSFLALVEGGIVLQSRACGEGIIDFGAILQILAAHSPHLTLTLECNEPQPEPRPTTPRVIGLFESEWVASHPDLSVEEYAALLALAQTCRQRIEDGQVVDWLPYTTAPFGYTEAVGEVRRSAAHLRTLCTRLNIPLEGAP